MIGASINKLLVSSDHWILKAVCRAVEPGDPLPFVADMIRVCRHRGPNGGQGVGLAAPQIGVAKRVIVTLVGHPATYINPVLQWASDETDVAVEGCLSYPGVNKAIRRPVAIRLSYENGRREPRVETFYDFLARVLQHELDHLDGICRVGDDAYPDARLPADATYMGKMPGTKNVARATWPYGTRKRVKVVEVIDQGRARGLICEHLEQSGGATILLSTTDEPAPETGKERTIEFRAGGPFGGHWALLDEPAGSAGGA